MKKTTAKSRNKQPQAKQAQGSRSTQSKIKTKSTSKPAAKAEESIALYLYGISERAADVNTSECPGIGGVYNVRDFEVDGLACWISEVDHQQFAANLERNMENLQWLATAGVNHQKTVEKLAAQTTIVPARFGAVFTSVGSLRQDVRGRSRQLAQTLRRLHGAEEWGVKIFYAPQNEVVPGAASSGREYLAQKAKVLHAARSRGVPSVELREFVRNLQKGSLDWAKGQTTAGPQNMVWNGSFLLKKDQREQFDEVLRNFAQRWQRTHQIECTGPWPPYSFV